MDFYSALVLVLFFVRPLVAKVHNWSEKYNTTALMGCDFQIFKKKCKKCI
jgi:hypothetical protein